MALTGVQGLMATSEEPLASVLHFLTPLQRDSGGAHRLTPEALLAALIGELVEDLRDSSKLILSSYF